ncbi:zinc finger, CCHC-type containing protein [Tanacetum coccineum]
MITKDVLLAFSMSMVYVLTTPIPKDGGDNSTMEQIKKRAKKELWDSLEAKYKAKEANQRRISLFTQHKMNMDEAIQFQSIIELKDAIFDENRLSFVPRPSLRIPNGTEDIGGSVVFEEVTEEDDPKTFDEAMKSQDVVFLKEAINDEMDSIMGNNTWVLADLPPGCKPLGCKWIFNRKLKIAITSIHNLIIHQMDVKTAFLNGDLDEEIYMSQPQGFIIPGNENKVDLTKEFLSSRFSMKDMGEADVILRIRIKHESNGIAISQSYYIEKVLKKFNYFDCTPVSTHIDTSEKLMPNNGQAVS